MNPTRPAPHGRRRAAAVLVLGLGGELSPRTPRSATMSIRRYEDLRNYVWPRLHRPRRRDWQLVRRINACASELQSLSDRQLADRTGQLRELVDQGRDVGQAEIARGISHTASTRSCSIRGGFRWIPRMEMSEQ